MIVFTDVETTGLDESTGDLLEVALVVTDDKLVEVAAFSALVVPPDLDATIAKMDPYVKAMHTKNGLIDELRTSIDRAPPLPMSALNYFTKELTDAFKSEPPVMSDKCGFCKLPLRAHLWDGVVDKPNAKCPAQLAAGDCFRPQFESPIKQTPLAGFSVSFDRRWLKQHMPALEGLFSHRSIDASSFTEMAKRFAPAIYSARPKAGAAHRALADARESAEYLRYYIRSGLFAQTALSK